METRDCGKDGLLSMNKEPSSNPQYPCEKLGTIPWPCSPRITGRNWEGPRDFAACLAQVSSFGFNEKPDFQGREWEATEKSGRCPPLASICMLYQKHSYTYDI